MIKLEKLEKPEVLVRNSDNWTKEYLRLKNNNLEIPDNLKKAYNHPEIKRVLEKETHNKCCYCESKLSHIIYGDVEHILPKFHRPDLIFEWNNLSLACDKCNRTYKNDYYNPSAPLINPYVNNPSAHILAIGSMLVRKPGDILGLNTIKTIGLNRIDLIERRTERIESLLPLVELWVKASTVTEKSIYAELIKDEVKDDKEYSFVLHNALVQIGFIF